MVAVASGRDDSDSTAVHDITLRRNVIEMVLGNTDGAGADFAQVFGFGLYIDNYSRDVESDGISTACPVTLTPHAPTSSSSSGSARTRAWPTSDRRIPAAFAPTMSVSVTPRGPQSLPYRTHRTYAVELSLDPTRPSVKST
ncbi:MAG: hypothetical protein JW751_28310 [Polyangiaceae bacterium]|nr:hypothetical protein [Polyangiaceae bacterium]